MRGKAINLGQTTILLLVSGSFFFLTLSVLSVANKMTDKFITAKVEGHIGPESVPDLLAQNRASLEDSNGAGVVTTMLLTIFALATVGFGLVYGPPFMKQARMLKKSFNKKPGRPASPAGRLPGLRRPSMPGLPAPRPDPQRRTLTPVRPVRALSSGGSAPEPEGQSWHVEQPQ